MSKHVRIELRSLLSAAVAVWIAASAHHVHAAVVGRAISPDGNLNVVFNVDADGDANPDVDHDFDSINEGFTSTANNMFGISRRGEFSLAGTGTPREQGDPAEDANVIPFSLSDDSLSVFPADVIGIIKGGTNGNITDADFFFGVADLNNAENTVQQQASWTFDVSSASGGLVIKIDMAAMGDFEEVAPNVNDPADFFDFDISIDGGAFAPLFHSFIDEDAEQMYTLENPATAVQTLADPVTMDGVMLNNEFQTLMKNIGSATNSVVLRFTSFGNGTSEAFAFRNILVEDGASAGVPGDYNGNGTVDAADYVLWKNGGPLQNEVDTPGTVNQADYTEWRSRFGNPGSGLGNGATVPEPASFVLLAMGLMPLMLRRRAA